MTIIVIHSIQAESEKSFNFTQDTASPKAAGRMIGSLQKTCWEPHAVEFRTHNIHSDQNKKTLIETLQSVDTLHVFIPFTRDAQLQMFDLLNSISAHTQTLPSNLLIAYRSCWVTIPREFSQPNFFNLVHSEFRDPWNNQNWVKSAELLPKAIKDRITDPSFSPKENNTRKVQFHGV